MGANNSKSGQSFSVKMTGPACLALASGQWSGTRDEPGSAVEPRVATAPTAPTLDRHRQARLAHRVATGFAKPSAARTYLCVLALIGAVLLTPAIARAGADDAGVHRFMQTNSAMMRDGRHAQAMEEGRANMRGRQNEAH